MTRCVLCSLPILGEPHDFHDEDCTRFLAGYCACDRQTCGDCCPDSACVTPLAAQLRAAHNQHVAWVPADEPEAVA